MTLGRGLSLQKTGFVLKRIRFFVFMYVETSPS